MSNGEADALDALLDDIGEATNVSASDAEALRAASQRRAANNPWLKKEQSQGADAAAAAASSGGGDVAGAAAPSDGAADIDDLLDDLKTSAPKLDHLEHAVDDDATLVSRLRDWRVAPRAALMCMLLFGAVCNTLYLMPLDTTPELVSFIHFAVPVGEAMSTELKQRACGVLEAVLFVAAAYGELGGGGVAVARRAYAAAAAAFAYFLVGHYTS
eukprot:CAMPEP_0198324192 /NCGR_PEP_ID=MMETSP1450-20131203/12261_1 /TAXON_ID=753684 ORGANISM="Madagascaria erythrocladiodes, Strain CCMP3234" /NCGR_SAMPLE_ID=MMETSP1450 /ASSEMBLY_ACC=CAM_ASM_001115 /LENGTH=213 /DNA_ID=CAMNT_0044027971 /DNA_START=62 /DNA_END=700 /DNA_ORIENTATION=-